MNYFDQNSKYELEISIKLDIVFKFSNKDLFPFRSLTLNFFKDFKLNNILII